MLLLLFPAITFAQKVKNQTSGEVGELKNLSEKYCIVITSHLAPSVLQVQADEETFDFFDEISGKKLKFKNEASILNYMDKNGWDYVSTYIETLQYFVFKKKEISN